MSSTEAATVFERVRWKLRNSKAKQREVMLHQLRSTLIEKRSRAGANKLIAAETGIASEVKESVNHFNSLLRSGKLEEANDFGETVWETFLKFPPPATEGELAYTMWWMLGLVEGHFQAGDFESAMEVNRTLIFNFLNGSLNSPKFGNNGLVIGNPWFHLRLAQIKFESTKGRVSGLTSKRAQSLAADKSPGAPLDELTRAVTSAGFQILHGEARCYGTMIEQNLTVPQGCKSWPQSIHHYSKDGFKLMKQFPMNYCHGPIRDLLVKKLHAPRVIFRKK